MEVNKGERKNEGGLFSDSPTFSQFILKYMNCFSKRKYFTVNKNFEIIKKDPSYILELASIYYEKKDDEIEKIIKEEFKETYKEKAKRIERMSKVETVKLIGGFRRVLVNKDEIHAVKLGNELLHRDREIFFNIMYSLSFISGDVNKLVKVYFTERLIEKMSSGKAENLNKKRTETDEIVKNVINYFVRSDYGFIDFNDVEEIAYFKENKADLLYKKIYSENFKRLKAKYNLENIKRMDFQTDERKEYEKLSESKKKLYKYLNSQN